jgi:magnesium and cobalt exporter, CNNM family
MLVVRPAQLFQRALSPFITLLHGAGRTVLKLMGLREPSGHGMVHSEEELKMLVTASQEAGVLEEDEEQMLHRVFHFSEFTAAQMMVPRTEMAAVPADAPLAEIVDIVVRGRHTSLPVYREEVDDVIGIMLVTDLVKALAAPAGTFSAAAIAREALTVPETMKADHLLRQMRRHRTHQAIVIDEYGGTAGLVTFERVMERIVGQLGGDFGTAGRQITQMPDGSAEVDGLALVSDINEQFGLEIDEETYSTIGGYMLGRLGRRPKMDDTVEAGGRTLTVVTLDGLRVARVRIQKAVSSL